MTKGELACLLRGHSSTIMTWIKLGDLYLDLDPTNLKPKLVQAIVIPNITFMLNQNQLINVVATTMTKDEQASHFRGHNSAISKTVIKFVT